MLVQFTLFVHVINYNWKSLHQLPPLFIVALRVKFHSLCVACDMHMVGSVDKEYILVEENQNDDMDRSLLFQEQVSLK